MQLELLEHQVFKVHLDLPVVRDLSVQQASLVLAEFRALLALLVLLVL